MSMYEASIPQFDKMLGNLDKWLEKAEAYAQGKSFDATVLLQDRLAPDMLPLMKQIQIACDWAKGTAARLSGKQPPAHPDTEQSLADARARIKTCRDYLKTFKPEDFAGAESRLVAQPYMQGKAALGWDYLHESAIPNFYFHVTTAYAILRHNGVGLGKADYIGSLRLQNL